MRTTDEWRPWEGKCKGATLAFTSTMQGHDHEAWACKACRRVFHSCLIDLAWPRSPIPNPSLRFLIFRLRLIFRHEVSTCQRVEGQWDLPLDTWDLSLRGQARIYRRNWLHLNEIVAFRNTEISIPMVLAICQANKRIKLNYWPASVRSVSHDHVATITWLEPSDVARHH